MTTSEPEELGQTAPVEVPPPGPEPEPPPPAAEPNEHFEVLSREPAPVASQAMAAEVTYVPMAVTIGDGFKFGCGFFLAAVVAMLVGFVLLAALFVLTSVFGVNLPLAR